MSAALNYFKKYLIPQVTFQYGVYSGDFRYRKSAAIFRAEKGVIGKQIPLRSETF